MDMREGHEARGRGWFRSLGAEPPRALDVMALVFERKDRRGTLEVESAKVPRVGDTAQARHKRVMRAQTNRSIGYSSIPLWMVIVIPLAILVGVVVMSGVGAGRERMVVGVFLVIMLGLAVPGEILWRGRARRTLRLKAAAARRSRGDLVRRALRDPAGTRVEFELRRADWLDATKERTREWQSHLVDQAGGQMLTMVSLLMLGMAVLVGVMLLVPALRGQPLWPAALVASIVWRKRVMTLWLGRVRAALAGKACADCGYGLEGAPVDERARYLGPRRCPECGGRWPCVPPGVRGPSAEERRAATMTEADRKWEAEKARRRASLSRYEEEREP